MDKYGLVDNQAVSNVYAFMDTYFQAEDSLELRLESIKKEIDMLKKQLQNNKGSYILNVLVKDMKRDWGYDGKSVNESYRVRVSN